MRRRSSRLDPKKRYLQVALNGTLEDARAIIAHMPLSDRVLLEAGTPLIKRYGQEAIRNIRDWYALRLAGQQLFESAGAQAAKLSGLLPLLGQFAPEVSPVSEGAAIAPYVVADLKTMDRGETEVGIAAEAGASAVIALGAAPVETLNAFIVQCEECGIDSMVDMMHVEFPLSVLRALKRQPTVVILHRGVDEERFNREKQLPLHEIRRIKGNYDTLISIAGGDTVREVQRAVFNDADIVVIWKSVYQSGAETSHLIEEFLKQVK